MKRQNEATSSRRSGGTRADAGWVVVWGGAAALFALVGGASLYLGGADSNAVAARGGTALPPAGDVGATASIGRPAAPEGGIEIYPSFGGVEAEQARRAMAAELETLRREVAALRRGMAMLQEQRHLAAAPTPDTPAEPVVATAPAEPPAAPARPTADPVDTARSLASPESVQRDIDRAVEAVAGKPTPVETVPAPARPDDTARASGTGGTASLVEAALPEDLRKPVRIVPLAGAAPEAVASISPAEPPRPSPLAVTPAAGRLAASADARIARTDFMLDLGRFDDAAAANAAWEAIRAAQTLLPAGLAPQTLPDGQGRLRLLAGPFPNAADAAAACVYLAADDLACAPVPAPQPASAAR